MIILMNMWLIVDRKENIQHCSILLSLMLVIYKNGLNYVAKMRKVMKRVKYFGLEDNVWEPGSWNGEGTTKLGF